MLEKELQLRDELAKIDTDLGESRLIFEDFKRKLQTEETVMIGLKIKKSQLEEQLKKYMLSLPDAREQDLIDKDIDIIFRERLPYLMDKIK